MSKIMNTQPVMAVLAANGLHENDLTEAQKAVQKNGVKLKIISIDQGLLSSWNASGWGLSFAVDQALNQALAADYDALLIPGGRGSVAKLKMTAHTKRFVGGFIENGKPVVAIDEGVELLAFSEKVSGRTLSGADSLKETIEKANAAYSPEMMEMDGNIMTVTATRQPGAALAPIMADFLGETFALKKAA